MGEKFFPAAEEIASWQNYLDQLGPRLTGSKAHQTFIEFLVEKMKALKLDVKEDGYEFDRWEANTAALTLHSKESEAVDIPVASVFPYSGETPPEGVTAEVVFCKKNNFARAKGKIACVEVVVSEVPSALVFKYRNRYPGHLTFRKKYSSPLVSSFLKAPDLKKAAKAGVLGVICIWKNASSENVEQQYLPFTTAYQGLPAVWVESAYKNHLLQAAETGGRINLRLLAQLTPKARTKTIYTLVHGENPNETIIINTHTDGPNSFEENGPLGLLALLHHFKNSSIKPKRSLVFVFATGHFQLPQLGIEGRQATSRWLKDHPEFWDGENGNANAVAGVTIEHLGCMEWQDSRDRTAFLPTGNIEPELVYTANKALDQLYLQTVSKRTNTASFTLRPRNGIYLGEGQPLYQVGIPTVSFIPVPEYLCRLQFGDEKIKVDHKLMYEQMRMFLELVVLLDKQSATVIGKPQKQSFGLF